MSIPKPTPTFLSDSDLAHLLWEAEKGGLGEPAKVRTCLLELQRYRRVLGKQCGEARIGENVLNSLSDYVREEAHDVYDSKN